MRPKSTLLSVWAIGLGLFITTAPSAEAGQPWSCSCNGVTKRFIAATKACEWSQPKNRHLVNKPGGRRLLKACTRPEFVAWNRRACAQEKCTLPKALR
jgi:hypothetical protein